jgi:hypothetical protein
MVADALAGDRLIGMAMLRPGWESAGEPPPVYEVGGAGEIVESEDLEDGRFNIVLEGRFRYRIIDESSPGPYRLARVEEIPPASFRGRTDRDGAMTRLSSFADIAELDLPPPPGAPFAGEARWNPSPALRTAELRRSGNGLMASRYESDRPVLEWHNRIRFLAPFRPPDLDVGRNCQLSWARAPLGGRGVAPYERASVRARDGCSVGYGRERQQDRPPG